MKCTRYIKLIYLYGELETNEKQEVDLHLQSCKHCQDQFVQVQDEQRILKTAYASLPVISPDVKRTERIMHAINEKETSGVDFADQIFQFLQHNPIRYAMAMTSVLLIGFFILELQQVPDRNQTVKSQDTVALQKEVKFNSDRFNKPLQHSIASSMEWRYAKVFSLYECIRVCRNSDDQNCTDCKTKYLNSKGYEDI